MPSRAHNGRLLDSAGTYRNLLLHMGISAGRDHRCDSAMSFGGQTVTFVSYTDSGSPGALGTYAQTETTTSVPNCRHRPLTFAETAEFDVDVATELWRTTIPVGEYSAALRAAVLTAKANDEMRVDGVGYKIVGGVRHHVDMAGNPFKVTVISKKHIG